ncbi:DUF1853 family protein [Paraburkholderia sprentiae WSM5005]|uniref:DUF1853 family protein n=1 Tax=Paraburkholderia sprentiae WSM5005 TaxID=754502 RepID=A0A1I9YKP2_9BURK|nr:DUF1853 family protein [Paraburkholderia sprentiae]APA86875.2 DUF1853 family protein [Paraburkholderia sprentiae WSM5005]
MPAGPAARVPAASVSRAAFLDTLLGLPRDASVDALRDPAVRDLAWLLLSPALLRPLPPAGALADPFDTPQELQATLDWLRALDAAPALLRQDLAAARITRLGRYAERLLGFFLRHGPAAQLVAAGVPLRHGGLTLGECDFLVQTRRGARLHWELAVKCYLHAGDANRAEAARLADYVGPNLKDRFDLKLAHLLHHQLPLSAREEFASTGYAGAWTPQMFVKGWLFYRHGETPTDPSELDPAHARGWWVTRRDWPAFARAHGYRWRVLPRLEWLAPRYRTQDGTDDACCVDADTLAAQTSLQSGPTMVAAFIDDNAGHLRERSRGFIVPDDWPEHAQRYAKQ